METVTANDEPQALSRLPAEVRDKVWVVVPAFNEAPCIGDVLREVLALYPHVIVVDDGSNDATGERAARAGAIVLRHAINRGQGAALQTGIDYALSRGADYIVTFDSDGQHLADDIEAVVDPVHRKKADVVLGSRFLGEAINITWSRRMLLKAALAFTRIMSGARITDVHNGLRCFSRRAAARIRIKLDRMAHASELIDQIHNSGLEYCEAPVRIRYTEYSHGKGQRGSAAFKILFHYFFGRIS